MKSNYYNIFVSDFASLGFYDIAIIYLNRISEINAKLAISFLEQNNPYYIKELIKLDLFLILLDNDPKVKSSLYKSINNIINSLDSKESFLLLKNLEESKDNLIASKDKFTSSSNPAYVYESNNLQEERMFHGL